MKLQEIYDLRETTGFISGQDLYEFFNELIGEPSPSGTIEIPSSIMYEHPLGAQIMGMLNAPLVDSLENIVEYTN